MLETIRTSELRLGMLTTACCWLVPIAFAHITQKQPLLKILKDLRRDLAFDRVNVAHARSQADIILDGMKVEDYLQKELQDVLERLESGSKIVHELTIRVEGAKAITDEWHKNPPIVCETPVKPEAMLRSQLDSIDLYLGKFCEHIKSVEQSTQKFSKKALKAQIVVGKSEVERINRNVESSYVRLKKEFMEYNERHKLFRKSLEDLSAKHPSLLSPKKPIAIDVKSS